MGAAEPMPDTNDTLTIDRKELKELNDRAGESAALRSAVKRVKFWGGVAFACATAVGVAWNFAEAQGREAAIEDARKEAVNGSLESNTTATKANATAIGANATAIGDNANAIDTTQKIQVESFDAIGRKLDSMSQRGGPVIEPASVSNARARLLLPAPPPQ